LTECIIFGLDKNTYLLYNKNVVMVASPSPQTAQILTASIASVAFVFGVVLFIYKGGKNVPKRTMIEAMLVSLALVALVIQSAVAPVRLGFRGWKGPYSPENINKLRSKEGFDSLHIRSLFGNNSKSTSSESQALATNF
jgi:hypothetical protein